MSATNTYVKRRQPKPEPVKTYTGSADAIDISIGDHFVLNRTGAVNAATLADPTNILDDGRTIWIRNGTTQANTITLVSGLGGSGSGYTVITFSPVTAANVTLKAYGGVWHRVASYLATFS